MRNLRNDRNRSALKLRLSIETPNLRVIESHSFDCEHLKSFKKLNAFRGPTHKFFERVGFIRQFETFEIQKSKFEWIQKS